jgi:hypothetical protein
MNIRHIALNSVTNDECMHSALDIKYQRCTFKLTANQLYYTVLIGVQDDVTITDQYNLHIKIFYLFTIFLWKENYYF